MNSTDELKLMSERLQQAMRQSDLSYGDIASITNIPKSAVHRYISGETPKIPLDRLEKISAALNVSASWIMGWSDDPFSNDTIKDTSQHNDIFSFNNVIPLPKMRKIPLLGTIACGEPILAEENIEGDVSIPDNIVADFALRCKGDSMIDARILDGDVVYIRQQPTVNNGEIAAVLIGDEATLKKVYLSGDTLTLLACNSSYEPFVYSGEQLNEIRILGKAVGFTSKI